jgi:hypothetical protein
LNNTQTKTKNRHKNKQSKESANLPKKDTKRDTNLRDRFRQLETLVQSHTETQLKLHHNGIKIYKPITRCPTNTKIHALERQKRHYFRLIQQYVDKHIDLALHTKNDHSALFKRNRLQLDNKWYKDGAGSSEGLSDNFRHPTPSSLSTLTNPKSASATSSYTSNNNASHSTRSSPRRPS